MPGFGPIGSQPIGGPDFPLQPVGYDQFPTDLFTGYLFDGTYLKIPIAVLTPHGLTATTAAADTGDARHIGYALIARLEEWFKDLGASEEPQAFTVTPRLDIAFSASDFADKEKTELKFIVYRNRPEGTVADEP